MEPPCILDSKLIDAPAKFESVMNGLFGGPGWEPTLVYSGDVFVYSQTVLPEHLFHLEKVFEVLRNYYYY